MTSLAGLSKIVVRFSLSSPLARPVREFLARVGCSKARATNPNCEVRAELVDTDPRSASTSTSSAASSVAAAGTVEVLSSDKKSAVIDASGLTVEAIVQRVLSVGAAAAAANTGPARGGGGGGGASAAAALAASGPPPALMKQQLETAWGLAGSFDAGTASKVTP